MNASRAGYPALEKAVNKLLDASKVVERRMGVRAVEAKRIEEAFRLLSSGVIHNRGVKQQEIYLDFLKRVRALVGDAGVVLCAASLGSSAIANMNDSNRVDLPFRLKERAEILQGEHLCHITRLHQSKGQAAHTQHFADAGADIATDAYVRDCNSAHLTAARRDTEPHGLAPDYLTGDVYELNVDDVLTVATSNEISGKILLTDTYKVDATSFLTIPITQELTNKLLRQRPRFM